jgi:hypothetical protein
MWIDFFSLCLILSIISLIFFFLCFYKTWAIASNWAYRVCALSQAHAAPISSAVNLCPLRQQKILRELKCRMKTNIYPSLPHIKWKNIFPVNYHLFILKCEILTTILLGKKYGRTFIRYYVRSPKSKDWKLSKAATAEPMDLRETQFKFCNGYRGSKHTFQI